MTEEDFLTRWSRRKRDVAKAEAEPPVAAKPAVEEPSAEVAPTPDGEFDIASLPPIESINALTDVTAFLRAGVPAELARAALRRVWTADPAIRDFVGLAENAWDFTDPNAMPGFGPLESTDEIRRMIASVVDQIGQAAEGASPHPEQSASDSKPLSESRLDDAAAQASTNAGPADGNAQEPDDSPVLLQSSKVNIALQHDAEEGEQALPKSSRRAHGGALPK